MFDGGNGHVSVGEVYDTQSLTQRRKDGVLEGGMWRVVAAGA